MPPILAPRSEARASQCSLSRHNAMAVIIGIETFLLKQPAYLFKAAPEHRVKSFGRDGLSGADNDIDGRSVSEAGFG